MLCWGGHKQILLSRVQNDIQPLVPSTPHQGMKPIRRKSQNMHTLNLISTELQGENKNKVSYGLTTLKMLPNYLQPEGCLHPTYVALVTRCISFTTWGGGGGGWSCNQCWAIHTTPPSANRSHPQKGVYFFVMKMESDQTFWKGGGGEQGGRPSD